MLITFQKQDQETESSIISQLEQNKLFAPLISFLHQKDWSQLVAAVQNAKEKEFTIAELKELLAYDPALEENLVEPEKITLLATLLQNNKNLQLPLPYLVCLDKKNLKKMLRINKYYSESTYLFHKFPSQKILKNETFLLPFLQLPVLLSILSVLPAEQKISVAVIEDLNSIISVKAMLAINKKVKENPKIQPSSATLIMSEECNLRCIYCYEPHQKRDKTVLSFAKAKQVLRKFDRDAKVSFFGGEPMLHVELMKQICEWGWEFRNLHFEMVTNGQIIDREFFRDYAKYFTYVQLSVDGLEAAHDINRGHGSFKRAMEFYQVFKEETGRYPTLHPVLSKFSLPYLLDIVKWFYAMEADQSSDRYSFRWLPGDAASWQEEDFILYAEQLMAVKKWYLEHNIRSTNFSIRAFAAAEHDLLNIDNGKQLNQLRDCDSFCSAGRTLMAVLPNGTMVPCHHEYWCAPEQRVYEEIALDEDSPGLNHMSELCLKDIPQCNSCPQWGCCVCPGSFYFQGRSYTKPDQNWCRAGKMLIETARTYAEDLAALLRDDKHKLDYLAAGMDYLLQKEIETKK
jgi:uncharacterized protein